MTLDRKALSPGVRLMLWACPLFMGKLGLDLLGTSVHAMLETPAFRTLNGVIPLKTLAVLCLLVAVGQLCAIIIGRVSPYLLALGVMGAVMGAFTVVWAVSWLQGVAPSTAMDWPALAAVCAVATLISLGKTLD